MSRVVQESPQYYIESVPISDGGLRRRGREMRRMTLAEWDEHVRNMLMSSVGVYPQADMIAGVATAEGGLSSGALAVHVNQQYSSVDTVEKPEVTQEEVEKEGRFLRATGIFSIDRDGQFFLTPLAAQHYKWYFSESYERVRKGRGVPISSPTT